MAAWTWVVVVVEMEKRPTGAPCSAQAHFLSRPCHQSVLTNSEYREACPQFRALCWSLLFQEAFRRQSQSGTVFRKLCVSSALRMLTPDAALGLGGSLLHSRGRLHFSGCLAFSLWKVNALLAFAEWYQQGASGNYICQ